MKNFEELLQEIKSIARDITEEEFEQDLKEYDQIYNKRDYKLILSSNSDQEYTLTYKYFSVDAFDVFADDTYLNVG